MLVDGKSQSIRYLGVIGAPLVCASVLYGLALLPPKQEVRTSGNISANKLKFLAELGNPDWTLFKNIAVRNPAPERNGLIRLYQAQSFDRHYEGPNLDIGLGGYERPNIGSAAEIGEFEIAGEFTWHPTDMGHSRLSRSRSAVVPYWTEVVEALFDGLHRNLHAPIRYKGTPDGQQSRSADGIGVSREVQSYQYQYYSDALGYKFSHLQAIGLFLFGCAVVCYNFWKLKFCAKGYLDGFLYGAGILLGAWLIVFVAPTLTF